MHAAYCCTQIYILHTGSCIFLNIRNKDCADAISEWPDAAPTNRASASRGYELPLGAFLVAPRSFWKEKDKDTFVYVYVYVYIYICMYERSSKLLIHGQTMDDLGGSYRFTRISPHVSVRYRFALVKVRRPSDSLILLVACPALCCPLPAPLLPCAAPLLPFSCPLLAFAALYLPYTTLFPSERAVGHETN